MRPQLATSTIDQAIACVALRQHGVATYARLVAVGLHPRAISHRVTAGKLHRVHRSVFAVGHAG